MDKNEFQKCPRQVHLFHSKRGAWFSPPIVNRWARERKKIQKKKLFFYKKNSKKKTLKFRKNHRDPRRENTTLLLGSGCHAVCFAVILEIFAKKSESFQRKFGFFFGIFREISKKWFTGIGFILHFLFLQYIL